MNKFFTGTVRAGILLLPVSLAKSLSQSLSNPIFIARKIGYYTKEFLNNKLKLLSVCPVILCLFFTSCEKANTDIASDNLPAEKLPVIARFKNKPPNIILILGDDIGYEVPAYTGGQSYATPNLDRIAQAGMQFTHCYGTPMCSPSRFEIMTGKYNNRNYHSWGQMDRSQLTIANLMRRAGYTTCITGKWQLDGGDASIHKFGFDTYSITNPFADDGETGGPALRLYKNPTIYQYGNYLPEENMKGKYGEDINRNFLFRFIDSVKDQSKPFFAVWTPNLCHEPFSPTPDDPAFATWDPQRKKQDADTIYFPSMIKYFDKEIGFLVNKLKSSGLESNTIVLLVIGDNGTDPKITSLWNGQRLRGAKTHTYERGIHVPMIAYSPGLIGAGRVNTNLVDFTDFLPTLAELAGKKIPSDFGVIDGISFAPQLSGNAYTPRSYCFGYYDVNRRGPDAVPPVIWSFNKNYKLYEDSSQRFYNYLADPYEKKLITGNISKQQKNDRAVLDSVIHAYLQE